ncbi:MAG: hypothetical protein LUC33_07285 [Prevotellaceae bacterium]|nr:hypothetical protein [Prevotellaceae bacterium]
MAVEKNPELQEGEVIQQLTGTPEATAGTVGLSTQLGQQATTVSGLSEASGGIGAGQLFESAIDEKIYRFKSDDTPLMQMMMMAKTVKVNSPVVDHYQFDEPQAMVTTIAEVEAGKNRASLPLASGEGSILPPYSTLSCIGVDGYDQTGQTVTAGQWLMLFVTGVSTDTGYPIVSAVNGPRTAEGQPTTVPGIPAGTDCVILSNACYETQKFVKPDSIVPAKETLYLQKRVMNQIVSDYFDSQDKRIPFSDRLIAEQALTNFKLRCNRSLWLGIMGKFDIDADEMGISTIYTSKGARWMFKREMQKSGDWKYEDFVALAKMFYTGEDVPTTATCLCGKNFLERIQKIDWSDHNEVHIEQKTNRLGWSVTAITTVFGEFQFKREPTLDRVGLSNSCGIFGEGRLVHYQRTPEKSSNEDIIGEEAKRNILIRWDAIGMKGTCNIWVDGESSEVTSPAEGVTKIVLWTEDTAPDSPVDGVVYYFLQDVDLDGDTALSGETWKYTTDDGWTKYKGIIFADDTTDEQDTN